MTAHSGSIILKNTSLTTKDHMILNNISMELKVGTIHALLGDSASGKVSIGKVLAGHNRQTSGTISIDSIDYRELTIRKAQSLGIFHISKEQPPIYPHLTIAENLWLTKSWWFNKAATVRKAQKQLDELGIDLNAEIPVGDLIEPDQQVISILKMLNLRPRLLIIDEALNGIRPEHEKIIANELQRVVDKGTSILWITEQMDKLQEDTDFVSVIRNGEIVLTEKTDNVNTMSLINLCFSDNTIAADKRDYYGKMRFNEAIIKKLPTSFIAIDDSGVIKLLNETAMEFFSIQTIEHESLSTLFKESCKQIQSIIKSATKERQLARHDGLRLKINNCTLYVDLVVYPVLDNSNPIGTVLSFSDKTDYEQLRERVVMSEQLASIGILAAGVAHEINNPLEIMSSCLRYLIKRLQGSPLLETAEELDEEIAHLHQIVSNLVTFSTDDGSTFGPILLNEMIKRIVELIKYNAEFKRIKISFKPSEKSCRVNGNSNDLKQVILNLIRNSFDAIKTEGEIVVSTAVVDNSVQIVIKDNGQGIPLDNPNDIFLPFYSTKGGSGAHMGLGLAIVYNTIEQHNGIISVENNANCGCSFIISLPLV